MKTTRFSLALAIFLVALTAILVAIPLENGALLLVSLAGFGLLFLGLTHLRKAGASWDWDRVPGQVLHSRIEKLFDHVEGEQVSRIHVSYSYSVDGRTCKSNRFRLQRPGENVRSFLDAKSFNEKFAAGSTVEVFVNPLDPTDSVLEPGMSERARSHQIGLVASGIVVVACSAAIAWFIFYGKP